MWKNSPVFYEDMERFSNVANIPWNRLKNKSILVTGATGLIGYTLVCALIYTGKIKNLGLKVLALVRDKERARIRFEEIISEGYDLNFIEGSVEALPSIYEPVHFIVHGASQTASQAFIDHPVETIETAVAGTKCLLELAKDKCVESFVYLSSMEAYGSPAEEILLREDEGACFDSMSVRSCYPESKRMCEALCAAYASEYDTPVKVIRLAQTFGPGVSFNDKRVFIDFAQKALKGKDIVLRTEGNSCRMYLYTMDAAVAILTILLKGQNGECYNAGNKETYCSIKEMAEVVALVLSSGQSKVIIQIDEENIKKYPPTHKLKLDTSKLENLGWRARTALDDMYRRMVKEFDIC